MRDHIIRNPPPQMWVFRDNEMYLEKSGKEHRVKRMMLLANGTRDLFMIRTKDDVLEVVILDDIGKTDKVVRHYQDDVVVMEFDEPYPFGTPVLYWEMNDKSAPLIEMALKLFYEGDKGENYDTYIGREYLNAA